MTSTYTKPKQRNIMIDMAFAIETEHTFETLTKREIVSALLKRVASLMDHWEPDAFGYCDEYTIPIAGLPTIDTMTATLKILRSDAELALDDEWDRSDEGFEEQITLIDDTLCGRRND